MKKFIMITPLQPVTPTRDFLQCSRYEAVGNERLRFDKSTRFPLMAVINAYAEPNEEIRVLTVTPDTDSARIHEQQLRDELASLQEEKGFICRGVEAIPIAYAGDVDTQLELFRKLLPVFEEGDTLYACLTYGNKPMPIAELMAIEYAYRVVADVAIGCLVYGELDHSAGEPAPMRIFDITSLIRLDEIVRMLAEHRVSEPISIINRILDFGEGE